MKFYTLSFIFLSAITNFLMFRTKRFHMAPIHFQKCTYIKSSPRSMTKSFVLLCSSSVSLSSPRIIFAWQGTLTFWTKRLVRPSWGATEDSFLSDELGFMLCVANRHSTVRKEAHSFSLFENGRFFPRFVLILTMVRNCHHRSVKQSMNGLHDDKSSNRHVLLQLLHIFR